MRTLGRKNIFLTEIKNGELHIIGKAKDGTEFDEYKNAKFKIVAETTKEFCSYSTMHGIRYLMERNRHFVERIWWVVAITLSAAFCVYSTLDIWTKWQLRPVTMTFEDKTTSISKIPFPAITICSTKKIDGENMKFRKFLENPHLMLDGITDEETYQVDLFYQLCLKTPPFFENYAAMPRFLNRTKTIYEVLRNSDDVLTSPVQSHIYGSLDRIITGEGLCHTFNSLNSHEIYTDEVTKELFTVRQMPNSTHWNLETGYAPNISEKEIYPYRVFDTGAFETFRVMIASDFDNFQELCQEKAQGYRISLHAPDELPRLPESFIFIPRQQDMYITVKPNLIVTSNELRRYSSEARGCYFKTERKLRFFKTYRQRHCELECLANYTKSSCGCIKFSMPGSNSTRICTLFDYICFENAGYNFSRQLLVQSCNCLPDCTSISYDVETSQVQVPTPNELLNRSDKEHWEVPSLATISFKHPHFIAMSRTETYTMSDFCASCGGLFGLFMGISVLSVVELIYFFSLRLFCNTTRKRNSVVASTAAWTKCMNRPINKNRLKKRRF